ncbi:MAG TPA: tetratricopeptide repeat protein, partial [Sedimentisphaerales bacterium]|nr:tetratricopeptide repeat protein [Sedimentisphaerales bacterium]
MEKPKDKTATGPEGLSARDIFASDESIHKFLDSIERQETQIARAEPGGWQASFVKVMVVANLTLITAMVVYLVLTRNQVVVLPATEADQPAQARAIPPSNEPIVPVREAVSSDDTAVAMQFAQELYEHGRYEQALAHYRALAAKFAGGQQDARLMAAYIQLKTAMCHLRLNRPAEAVSLLNACISGPSPAVAALASYFSAIVEMQAQRYTVARLRLYNCLAIAGALPQDLQESLERESLFLLAQATISRYLQIGGAKDSLPDGFWDRPVLDNPAARFTYEELVSFVSTGADLFPSVPLIRQDSDPAGTTPTRWTIAAKNIGVFDLLSRLGGLGSFSMRWDTADSDRTRPVSVRLVNRTPDGAAEIIAGSAGLMASLRNGVPTVINPESIMSLDDQKNIYAAESLQLLNRFIVLYPNDAALPTAYFAMAIVHERAGAATAAIANYKLIVSRYPNSPLVPFALWQSSLVKLSMQDRSGAKEDLQQLVAMNPDHMMHAQASMKLAELMVDDGMYREANRLFRKVYNMNPSGEYRTAAAFSAGQCLYKLG